MTDKRFDLKYLDKKKEEFDKVLKEFLETLSEQMLNDLEKIKRNNKKGDDKDE